MSGARRFGLLDPMPFGKHIGVYVGTVIENDPSYVQWLLDHTTFLLDEEALRYFEEEQ